MFLISDYIRKYIKEFMIKSIEFGEGGYITKKKTKTVFLKSGRDKMERFKQKNPSNRWEDLSEDGWIRQCMMREGRDFKEKDDGYLNLHLVKNLLGRKIEFESNKINVIFGPNACGKTTILKALAAYCQCGSSDTLDGWTNRFFVNPHNARYQQGYFNRLENREDDDTVVQNSIKKFMQNNAVVDWDGVPVYSDNFASRHGRDLGDLEGSILGDSGMEELLYIMGKNQMSLGQNSIFILNKIVPMMERPLSLEEVLGDKKLNGNEIWESIFNANIKRLEDIYNQNEHTNLCNTFLFDEMDKSMDIMNVALLYGQYLPSLVEKYGVQIIIVSHSPLILSKSIFDNPLYNIISIDEKYTKKCRKLLKKFKFRF